MAVRAQEPKVLAAVVVVPAVDVIDVKREPGPVPVGDSAHAARVLPSETEQPRQEPTTIDQRTFDEDFVVGKRVTNREARYRRVRLGGLASRPSVAAKMGYLESEPANALTDLAMRPAVKR